MMRVDHAPIDAEGGHTSYMLLPTETPGHVCAFPESNFRLTTAEHREAVRRQLGELGLTLETDE